MAGVRGRIQAAFNPTGIEYVISQTNFILSCTGPDIFEKSGALVREGEALGYSGWSRISRSLRGERPASRRALLKSGYSAIRHQSTRSKAMVLVAVSRSGMLICSSGACATFMSPAPYITHGIPPKRMKRRMSAP